MKLFRSCYNCRECRSLAYEDKVLCVQPITEEDSKCLNLGHDDTPCEHWKLYDWQVNYISYPIALIISWVKIKRQIKQNIKIREFMDCVMKASLDYENEGE